MFVPAWQVLCFTSVKRPIICALWYAFCIHLLTEPLCSSAIVISSIFLAISFFSVRFYMAIASPIPMLISLYLNSTKYPSIFLYVLIASAIWTFIYIVSWVVTYRNSKNIYYIDPVTNIMYKR